MNDKAVTLINELVQICQQYKAEVPGRRRAWPQSIKKRIFELNRLGVSANRIAEITSIPAATIYAWNSALKKSGTFLPVKVTARKPSPTPTVTVRKATPNREPVPSEEPRPTPTVTVVTPRGYRVEGLSYQLTCDLLFALENGGHQA